MVTEVERARITEAVETLKVYRRAPFLEDFIRSQVPPTIPLRYSMDQLHQAIETILLGEPDEWFKSYKIDFRSLVRYLDRLQETSRQYVYFFRLTEEQRQALRDCEKLRERIGGDDALWTEGLLVWEATEEPKLVRVQCSEHALM